MEQAEFIHYMRLSEYASAEAPQRYRRKVAAFAALGYAWVAGCLLAAVLVLAWVVPVVLRGGIRWGLVFMALGALGLAWSSVRALWVPLNGKPDGIRLRPKDAPALFKMLGTVRKKVDGPRLDEVYLDDAFNAAITQLPRRGLFGGHVNRLHLGLPLLMALDGPRVAAVLAHEYGHLRGHHGRFAAWVYRSRQSWARLNAQLDGDDGAASWLTTRFMSWYVPRFLAQTFALARQDEYEADRIAASLVGPQVAGAALIEISVKGDWLARAFWRQHWLGAATHALPQGPFKAMRHLLASPPEAAHASEALRQALRRPSNFDDTHPGLKDRLEALSADLSLPAWSSRSALSLLGPHAERSIAHFDQRWCRDHASAWKTRHARLQKLRALAQDWRQRAPQLSAEEWVMWADCERRWRAPGSLDELADRYERALQLRPGYAPALKGLVLSRANAPLDDHLFWLDTLWQRDDNLQSWAARQAVQRLESSIHSVAADTLARWRQRVKDAQASDQALWEALHTPPWLQRVRPHELSALDVDDALDPIMREPAVQRAWLVSRDLPGHGRRTSYLLLLDLPGLSDARRYALCRELERAIDVPGPVLALWAGDDPTLADIERLPVPPLYVRQAT